MTSAYALPPSPFLGSKTSRKSAKDIALEETWKDVENLVYHVTHKFARQYGVPFEDLVGFAKMSFLKTYEKFDPSRFEAKAKFSTVVQLRLQWNLISHMKKEKKHRQALSMFVSYAQGGQDAQGGALVDTIAAPSYMPAPRMTLESEMSESAREVARLIWDSPADLSKLMALDQVKSAYGYQETLKGYLEDVGWDRVKIKETFEELKTLFSS